MSALATSVATNSRRGNRKLEISTASTKAKLREPAYSQALVLNKIDRRVKSLTLKADKIPLVVRGRGMGRAFGNRRFTPSAFAISNIQGF